MTTAEFYNRLLRPLNVNSLESMSMNDGLELVDALNAALQWFYAAAPDVYRRKETSHYLPPSQTLYGDFVNGSNAVSNLTSADVQPDAMVVEGAGTDETNGVVVRAPGDINDLPYYSEGGTDKQDPNFSFVRRVAYEQFDALTGSWWVNFEGEIATSDSSYRSLNDGASTPDLVESWVVVSSNGEEPTPIVRYATWADVDAAGIDRNTVPLLNASGTWNDYLITLADSLMASVRVSSDENWNRAAGESMLCDAFQGVAGRHALTVYSDVIPLSGSTIERMATDPLLDTGRVIYHIELTRQHHHGYDIDRRELSFFLRSNERTVAEPRRYFMGHPGDDVPGKINDQGYILLDPIPGKAYTVTFDAFHRPQRFGINSLLVAPEVLPLAEDLIETILLPVAIEQLTDSPMWRGDERSISRAERRAGEARGLAQNLTPYIAVPNNEVGTPRGY